MIDFDFSYHRPSTVEEAVRLFYQFVANGKRPVYLSGGTEIITRARAGDAKFDAVIDIKDILPCNACQYEGDEFVTGAGATMTKVAESNLFPLLTSVLKGVADHTSRNKITIGGNICSHLIYREAILPYLVSDSQVVIAGRDGQRQVCAKDIFDQTLQLEEGDLLLQARTKKEFVDAHYVHIRKTKQTKIDYPLVTIVLLGINKEIRFACSGLYPFPFRSENVERILGNRSVHSEERARLAANELAPGVIDNILGASAYRKFIFQQGLVDGLSQLEAMMG